jgi:NADH-quinone oxidoreductase subunit F
MDLHIVGGEANEAERSAVDAVLGPPASGWQGGVRDIARDGRAAVGGRTLAARRDLLLPACHAVQDRIGWISRGALNYICTRLSVPPAEAWGVVTFYHLLATEPRPDVVAHVCDDIACRLQGADAVCRDLRARHGQAVHRSACLGLCDRGSAALITRAGAPSARFTVAPVTSAQVAAALTASGNDRRPDRHRTHVHAMRLLRRVGNVDPASLESYRASGGYQALARAVQLGPARVVAEVTASRLLGRGGAAFPTGRKWEAVAEQPARPHYVVCNADESEPGTFKDRVLLEEDPFAVVEAMTICAFATHSEHGFVYIRGEYPEAEARMAGAIAQARQAGLLGANVAGADFAFDIEIRRGGGAYICGEETALFNSIEGRRGEPRSKPPFPSEAGVFGKPTVVNNVETLANIPDIVMEGGNAFARVGTAESAGTRLFCVSGRVVRPGLYEVPCGTGLGTVIDLAGGVSGGRTIQAVLLGGAAGTFVGPDRLAMPLSFEAARAAGATLGSGVIMVFDETADLIDALRRIAEFFRHESCGQCVPCRVGTVRQVELLEACRTGQAGRTGRTGGTGGEEVMDLYSELARAMRDASICGLGQTASSALESAMANLNVFANGGPS